MEKEFNIANEQGIHARPATELVRKANQFKSDIHIIYDGKTIDMKSIIGVLSLGISRGSLVSIRCSGEDEIQAMKEISKFISALNMK